MVYLYASGLDIPYTLNFIEAWISGIPVVVYAPEERCGKYFEIDKLIDNGDTGFICRSITETRDIIRSLLSDHELATKIGSSGRMAAINRFGIDAISKDWKFFLENLNSNKTQNNNNNKTQCQNIGVNMKRISTEIFKTLSLLRPYDINLDKIKVGNERDGGYVLADLDLSRHVISFGVGPDVSFEYQLAQHGAKIYLHDHTVESCPQEHENFNFKKIGICGSDENVENCAPLIHHLDCISSKSQGMLLKMDIEGAEWEVLSTVEQNTLSLFDQIVLEVHWLERLSDPIFCRKIRKSLENITRQFTLFHVHANNCANLYIVEGFTVASVLELSFVRTSFIDKRRSRTIYPSSLNKSNHPDFPDHPLLFYPFIPMEIDQQYIIEMLERLHS